MILRKGKQLFDHLGVLLLTETFASFLPCTSHQKHIDKQNKNTSLEIRNYLSFDASKRLRFCLETSEEDTEENVKNSGAEEIARR